MESAGPDLHVIGLQQNTALLGPILLQTENDVLKFHAYGLFESFKGAEL